MPAEEPRQDFDSLRKRLFERLATYAGPTKVVLIIDAVNQLNGGHDLSWLPHQLGPSVRIILSTIEPPSAKLTANSAEKINSPPSQGGAGGGSGEQSQ
ncbi:MAG: hypothetical protein WD768_05880, partial [Phycisphaeraceae bacterium]